MRLYLPIADLFRFMSQVWKMKFQKTFYQKMIMENRISELEDLGHGHKSRADGKELFKNEAIWGITSKKVVEHLASRRVRLDRKPELMFQSSGTFKRSGRKAIHHWEDMEDSE